MFGKSIVAVAGLLFASTLVHAQATRPVEPGQTIAGSKVSAVTVYQGNALVVREVIVPEGQGRMELIVTPLPPQTIDSSLYTEAGDGIRVLATQYRTRAVREDTREEVRAKEQQIRAIQREIQKLENDLKVIRQNLQFLDKLETFTGSSLKELSDKGLLNAQSTIELSRYVVESRTTMSAAMLEAQQKIEDATRSLQFTQRELAELAAGSTRTERDAVIVVDKTNAAGGTVYLHYLVNHATWRPEYKLRSTKENEPITIEYLAAIEQQSGEDWGDVSVVLSTAEPMLSAVPPRLVAMDVTLGGSAAAPRDYEHKQMEAQSRRREAVEHANVRNKDLSDRSYNDAGVAQQEGELLAEAPAGANRAGTNRSAFREGPSVTYRLSRKLNIPSRNDKQLIEVARVDLKADYYYQAIPVLTQHVYRQADLTNTSEHILLPGPANVYLGADFVGRMDIPLVAIGETFTAGFGVDPQLQVSRDLVNKAQTVQGGNQVHTYDYRIRISSFKETPVRVQLWDRLPHAANESVGITLINTAPSLSTDAAYLRADRPKNLLRWDLAVEPGMNLEKALVVNYQFRLEYDRNQTLGAFRVTE